MDVEAASKIMEQVRDAFRDGAKSGNKAYVPAGSGPDVQPILPANPVGVIAKGAATADVRRNHNVVITQTTNYNARREWSLKPTNNSAILYGKYCMDNAAAGGNCTEMACAAAWLVSRTSFQGYIGLVTTDGAGDHVFCFIGPEIESDIRKWQTDKWRRLRGFPAACGEGIVIDPWAHICCKLSGYLDAFAEKATDWLGEGKRIFGGGNDWLAPDDEYVTTQFTSSIELRNARNNPPFSQTF